MHIKIYIPTESRYLQVLSCLIHVIWILKQIFNFKKCPNFKILIIGHNIRAILNIFYKQTAFYTGDEIVHKIKCQIKNCVEYII